MLSSWVWACFTCWHSSSSVLCCSFWLVRPLTWRLPVYGGVVDLVAAGSRVVLEAVADGACREVHWVSGSGPGRKRIRLNRKLPAHLAGLVVQSRPRVMRRGCVMWGIQVFLFLDHKRRRSDQEDGRYVPDQVVTGV